MQAYLFPGQGSQFPGMGQALYENIQSRELFDKANKILGFNISDIMFSGSKEILSQTHITQPAIFIHSVIRAKKEGNIKPQMMAGHSLGEFSALTVAGCLTFEDGLKLVHARAKAMQKACDDNPSTMAAVLGLEDELVDKICKESGEIVVAANYNCPGQIVISGTFKGIEKVQTNLKNAGARRVVPLSVAGAFHSPLMEQAQQELEIAVSKTTFSKPFCPVYQNVDALPYCDPGVIAQNLIKQLTAPVRWTQIIKNMLNDGVNNFVECGPGKVLSGLIRKIDRTKNSINMS